MARTITDTGLLRHRRCRLRRRLRRLLPAVVGALEEAAADRERVAVALRRAAPVAAEVPRPPGAAQVLHAFAVRGARLLPLRVLLALRVLDHLLRDLVATLAHL